MAHRDASMDKDNVETRQYCTKHKMFFRNSAAVTQHRLRHPWCVIIFKPYTTR
jgi:hypothetical protein